MQKMKTLQRHSYDFSQTLFLIFEWRRFEKSWLYASDWLRAASAIKGVEIDVAKESDLAGWCSSADEFDEQVSRAYSKFATNLSIFQFTWGAFEHIARATTHRSNREKYQIEDMCLLLSDLHGQVHNNWDPVFRSYLIELAELYKFLRNVPGQEKAQGSFLNWKNNGVTTVGINAVRRIRNSLAHASYMIPIHYPEDYDNYFPGERRLDTSLLESATRILLLSMQMVVQAYFQDETMNDCFWSENSGEYAVNGHRLIAKVHLQVEKPNAIGPQLFD